jgi:Zn-dependent peptidase ImmA (M78 family)
LQFVGKYTLQSDPFEIAGDIRKTLNLQDDWARPFQTWEKALDRLTLQIEEAGIIINFNGVVENNNHRPIKVEECRGFVLVNNIAPFMFINAADGKAAQMFTIVHELAHIWVGQSAGFDFKQMLPANDPVEQLCDKIAAEFLVPAGMFEKAWAEKPDVKTIARKFKVSPIVIGRRALDLGKMDKSTFFKFYTNYVNELQNKKERKDSGGDFYATQKKRLSLRFMGHVNQALKEGKILYSNVYKMTGLNGTTYPHFIGQFL